MLGLKRIELNLKRAMKRNVSSIVRSSRSVFVETLEVDADPKLPFGGFEMSVGSNHLQGDFFENVPEPDHPTQVEQPSRPKPCKLCDEKYLSDRQVAARFDISKATVWRWHESNPDFPQRVKLSPGTSRWKLSELIQFETKMQAKRHLSILRANSGLSK